MSNLHLLVQKLGSGERMVIEAHSGDMFEIRLHLYCENESYGLDRETLIQLRDGIDELLKQVPAPESSGNSVMEIRPINQGGRPVYLNNVMKEGE